MRKSSKLSQQKIDSAVDVEDWGLLENLENTSFNTQPCGISAMWVKVKSVSMPPETHVLSCGNEISGQDVAVQAECCRAS